ALRCARRSSSACRRTGLRSSRDRRRAWTVLRVRGRGGAAGIGGAGAGRYGVILAVWISPLKRRGSGKVVRDVRAGAARTPRRRRIGLPVPTARGPPDDRLPVGTD